DRSLARREYLSLFHPRDNLYTTSEQDRSPQMSSQDYDDDSGDSRVSRDRIRQLREEFEDLVRQRAEGSGLSYDREGAFGELRRELEKLRCAIERCCTGGEVMHMRPFQASPADPPSPPYPPY